MKNEIIWDIKETYLITNDELLKYDAEKDEFITTSVNQELIYDLPDKKTINLSQNRNLIIERVFNPVKELSCIQISFYVEEILFLLDSLNDSKNK